MCLFAKSMALLAHTSSFAVSITVEADTEDDGDDLDDDTDGLVAELAVSPNWIKFPVMVDTVETCEPDCPCNWLADSPPPPSMLGRPVNDIKHTIRQLSFLMHWR